MSDAMSNHSNAAKEHERRPQDYRRMVIGPKIDPRPQRGEAIKHKPRAVTPGLVSKWRFSLVLKLENISDFGLLQALFEAGPSKHPSATHSPTFDVSSETFEPVLQEWHDYVGQVVNALEISKSKEKKLRSLFKDLTLKRPEAADASSIVREGVVQFLETLALGRQQSELHGVHPITFKGDFVPEVRQTLLHLFSVPPSRAESFLAGIKKDLNAAAAAGTLRGKWGSLDVDGDLILRIIPRSTPDYLRSEPHLSVGWQPVQE